VPYALNLGNHDALPALDENGREQLAHDIVTNAPLSRTQVCACVCTYVHTCYVLTKPPMPIYYVLAAVFASCFYVLKSLLHV
jgi:hypothetical protein